MIETTERYCKCAETLIEKPDGTRVRIPSPEQHDCGYVARRNALIPKASRFASEQVPQGHGHRWTKVFANKMDELSRSL